MKIIITESQFDKAVFKYLDKQDFVKKKSSINIIYFLNSDDDLNPLIKYYKDGECFIKFELIEEISSFFSTEFDKSKYIIGRWVANTLGVYVTEIYIM